jgi:hypothetical protein
MPIAGLSEAIDQMAFRNQLWNQLVEIDRDFHKLRNDLLESVTEDSVIEEMRSQLRQIRSKLRASRRATGRDHGATAALENQAKALKQQIASARLQAKIAANKRSEAYRQCLKQLSTDQKTRIRDTRKGGRLYWCNYDEVLQDYQLAKAQAAKDGGSLHFRRWDGSGKVTVRFQNALRTSDAFSKSRRLQIEPVPEEAWTSESRAIRRKVGRTFARTRIGSNPDRTPVWLELPIILHRPMPAGGMIRSASVIREGIGLSWRYRLIVRVREESRAQLKLAGQGIGIAVRVHFKTGGLGVAEWYSENGSSGSFAIPDSDVRQFLKVDELQSIITSALREIQLRLGSWVACRPLPGTLGHLTQDALQDSSPRAMLRLTMSWEQARFPEDVQMFSAVADWRKQYIHLWTWQAHLRDQLMRRRRELYRRFAADLVGRCGQVLLSDETGRSSPTVASVDSRPYGSIAAISVLARTLENAC